MIKREIQKGKIPVCHANITMFNLLIDGKFNGSMSETIRKRLYHPC